jgi:cold shock CspA family protein
MTLPTGYDLMTRHFGSIDWWDSSRGYGFIQADAGFRLFVHVHAFASTPPFGIVPELRVSFEFGRDRRGRDRAVKVTVVEGRALNAGPGQGQKSEDRPATDA